MPDTDEITKAVKDALNDKRLEDLGVMMTNLSTQMTAGFTAVHTRQDTTNGKVLNNTSEIDKIKSRSLYEKVLWMMITSLVGLATYLLTKHV
jgi:hypothetical protein